MQVSFIGRVRRIAFAGIATTMVAIAPRRAVAQAGSTDDGIAPFSSVFLSTGTLLMNVTQLNPHFERLDLDPAKRPGFFAISNDGYAVGFGAYGAVLNRLVLGGEWNSADLGQEASPAGKTNQITTRYALGTIGYAAFTAWHVNVIPFVGIGAGKVDLILRSRDGGPTVPTDIEPTIDEIIASPGSRSVVTGSYFMVQPGVAIDVLLLRQTSSQMGVTLGIRFASAISPNRTTWTYMGRTVFGGPDVGPAGGVVRIVAGIGGFRMGGAPGR